MEELIESKQSRSGAMYLIDFVQKNPTNLKLKSVLCDVLVLGKAYQEAEICYKQLLEMDTDIGIISKICHVRKRMQKSIETNVICKSYVA